MSGTLFIHILILLGGLQGVGLGLVHTLRPTPFRWTRLLGWALAIHALSDVYLWLYWTRTQLDWGLLTLLPLNVVLLPVYLLFRYMQALTGIDKYRKVGGLMAICSGFEVVGYLLPAGAALYLGKIDNSVFGFAKTVRDWLTVGSLPFVIAMILVMYRLIQQYKQGVGTSAAGRIQVRWLLQLWVGLCAVYTLAQLPILSYLLARFRSRALFYPLGIGSSLFLVWAGIRAFVVHERFQTEDVPQPANEPEATSAQAALLERAVRLLEDEKLFKQPNLKLADVAGRLSISPHYLSRIINHQAQASFTDWVNTYRVAEVKRLMADPTFGHYTLEGLGLEAGFGAKSTYQASFKRLTGQTPSQYRMAHRPVS